MDIIIQLKDEISVILLWFGLYGLLEQSINSFIISANKNYLYMLFILISLFIKLP
jgi:hypothetical protein